MLLRRFENLVAPLVLGGIRNCRNIGHSGFEMFVIIFAYHHLARDHRSEHSGSIRASSSFLRMVRKRGIGFSFLVLALGFSGSHLENMNYRMEVSNHWQARPQNRESETYDVWTNLP